MITYHRDLTQDMLKSILHYEPATGVFTWVDPPNNHARLIGSRAGCNATGYCLIRIDKKKYKAHRLAWLYVHGVMPAKHLDHKDGDPFNNAISNLREATVSQNIANARRKARKALPKGVRKNGNGFTARITFGGKIRSLGTFPSVEGAAQAYLNAAVLLYGEFARAA